MHEGGKKVGSPSPSVPTPYVHSSSHHHHILNSPAILSNSSFSSSTPRRQPTSPTMHNLLNHPLPNIFCPELGQFLPSIISAWFWALRAALKRAATQINNNCSNYDQIPRMKRIWVSFLYIAIEGWLENEANLHELTLASVSGWAS